MQIVSTICLTERLNGFDDIENFGAIADALEHWFARWAVKASTWQFRSTPEHHTADANAWHAVPEAITLGSIQDRDFESWMVLNDVQTLFMIPMRAKWGDAAAFPGALALARIIHKRYESKRPQAG